MNIHLSITGYSSEAWRGNALDVAEATFVLLTAGPSPLAVDGAALGYGLPGRLIDMIELRDILLGGGSSPALRDAVWVDLVQRSRQCGSAWTIACVGVALPGLKKITADASQGLAPAQAEDVVAEMVTAFVAGLRSIDLQRWAVAQRLLWAARRAATLARRREIRDVPVDPQTVVTAPDSPGLTSVTEDHDAARVLADAVQREVLTPFQAELISITRLQKVPISSLSERLGVPAHCLYGQRQRAERRLATALLNRQLLAKLHDPTVNFGR